MADNPTPPESSELEKLVQLMQENNRATSEIERDGRNTRRHLLEMKKIQQASLSMSDSVNDGFQNFFETMNANKLADKEKATERLSIFEEIRDELRKQNTDGIKTESKGGGKDSGGRMSGIGKLLGGAGMGLGAAAAGIAAVFASSSFLLDTLENMDGKKIVANVKDLLEISNLPGEEGDALRVMGTLGAIGIGLTAFGIGSFFAKAASDETAQEVKDAVRTYLSINDLPGEEGQSARVMGTLSALGIGLAAFGIGSFFANAASADQAEEVKQSVATLLSIQNDPNIGGGKVVSDDLSALSGGLVKFGVGSFFAKASGEGQGAQIKESVSQLLSIAADPNANEAAIATAVGALGSLGVGLAAFGVGSFFAGIGDGIMSGESIRNEVADLLEIGGLGNIDKIDETVIALGALGTGLAAFGTGSFVGSLAGAAGAALDFLSGSKSPIDQAIQLGEKSDTINAGINSLTMFREELDRFSEMGKISGDLGLEEMAEDLLKASKLIRIAVEGGTDFRGINTDYKGLANIEGVEEATAAITRLKGALNMDDGNVNISTTPNNQGEGIMQMTAQNVELKTPNPIQQSTQVNTDASRTENMNQQIIMTPQKPDKLQESVASR